MRPKHITRIVLPCLLLSGASAQIGLHVRAITFSGDHQVLRDGPMNYSSDGTGLFSPNGFEEVTGTANPVSYSRGQIMSIFVDHQLLPVGGYYSLEGYSGLYGLQFYTDGLSAGYWRTDILPALSALPNRVTTLSYAMDWQAVGQQPEPAVGGQTDTSGGPIFVTWGSPLDSNPTRPRMAWACSAANWLSNQPQQTEVDVSDAIWNALAGDAPFEPGGSHPLQEGATWGLLDGVVSGECDEQAALMCRAVQILGVAGTTSWIRASSDTNVTNLETTKIDGRIAYLVFY